MNPSDITAIMQKHEGERGQIISILEDIQSKYSYLPEQSLRMVAEQTGHSLVDIFGVATFYKAFSLKPRGRHLISCCSGTACHVRGAPRIAKRLERELKIKAGETTPDKEFTFETVNCLGACALGPIVVVDGHYFSNVKPNDITGILERAKEGLDRVEVKTDKRLFPVAVSCPVCNHSLMDQHHLIDGYPPIKVTVSTGQSHGWLILSSLYGSYNTSCEFDIPEEAVVNFFCPHCHAELVGGGDCIECNAPMVPMIVRGGGMVQICSRRGCKNHMLDLNGINV